MATLDDSPSLYIGQSWSYWAENLSESCIEGPEEGDDDPEKKRVSDTMKLSKKDMSLYGLCPARDEFYLAVCEHCGQVVKPQALRCHMEQRHKELISQADSLPMSGSFSDEHCPSPSQSNMSKVHPAEHIPASHMSSGNSNRNRRSGHTSGTKHGHHGRDPQCRSPPREAPTDSPKDRGHSENHVFPVVKVERMESSVMKKATTTTGTTTATCSVLAACSAVTVAAAAPSPSPGDPTRSNGDRLSSSGSTDSSLCISSSSDSYSSQVVTAPAEPERELEPEPEPEPDPPGTNHKSDPAVALPENNAEKVKRILAGVAAVADEKRRTSPSPTTLTVTCMSPAVPVTTTTSLTTAISAATNSVSVFSTLTSLSDSATSVTSDVTGSPPSFGSAITIIGTAKPKCEIRNSHEKATTSVKLSSNPSIKSSVGKVTKISKSHHSLSSPSSGSTKTLISSGSSLCGSPPSSGGHWSGKKGQKDRKFIPCKDREFDADRHCGVWINDQARQCTRSLTCKTHALSLRRAVKGRSKPFDDLLRELRAGNEAVLRAKKEAAAAACTSPSATSPTTPTPSTDANFSMTQIKSPSSSTSSKAMTPITVSVSPMSSQSSASASKHTPEGGTFNKVPQISPFTSRGDDASSSKVSKAAPTKLFPTPGTARPSVVPIFPKGEPLLMAEGNSYLSSDGEDEEQTSPRDRLDYTCINHHPRPAVMNSFGGWQHGAGCYVFNRKEDLYRAAFMAAVEKHLHPPPHKKLCVESKLPKDSTISTCSKDPYEFTFGEMGLGARKAASLAGMTVASKAIATKVNKSKTPPTTPVTLRSPKLAAKEGGGGVIQARVVGAGTDVVMEGVTLGVAGDALAAASRLGPSVTQHNSGAGPTLKTQTAAVFSHSSVASSNLHSAKRKRSVGPAPTPGASISLGKTGSLSLQRSTGSASSGGGHPGGGVHGGMAPGPHPLPPHCSSPMAIPISITVPAASAPGNINFNLSSTTLSNLNATLGSGKTQQNLLNKGNLNIVVSSVDGPSLINGQLVSIPNVSLAEMTHIQLNSLSEKCARGKSSVASGGSMLAGGGRAGLSHALAKAALAKVPISGSALGAGRTLGGGAAVCTVVAAVTSTRPSATLLMEPKSRVLTSGGVALVTSGGGGGRAVLTSPPMGAVINPLVASGSISTPQASPVPSPLLASGAGSPIVTSSSPLANGLMTSSHGINLKRSNSSNHVTAGGLESTPGSIGNVNLAGLTEHVLAQSGTGFSITPVKSDGVGMVGGVGGKTTQQPTQVTLSAATAQQLAAAALNLTSTSGCLLTTSSMPQLYASQLLSHASPLGGPRPTFQFTSKAAHIKTGAGMSVGGAPGGLPLQPLSLTFMTPSGTGMPLASQAGNQAPHAQILLHAADERQGKDLNSRTASHGNLLS